MKYNVIKWRGVWRVYDMATGRRVKFFHSEAGMRMWVLLNTEDEKLGEADADALTDTEKYPSDWELTKAWEPVPLLLRYEIRAARKKAKA